MNGRSPFRVLLQWMIDRGGCQEGMAYSEKHWSGMTLDQTFADLAQVDKHPDFDPAWARWTLEAMLFADIAMPSAWKAALLAHMVRLRPDRCLKHYLRIKEHLSRSEQDSVREAIEPKLDRVWPELAQDDPVSRSVRYTRPPRG